MGIAEQIIANPEGGTVSLTGNPVPESGYFVGGMVSPLILPTPIEFTPDAAFEIETFVNYLLDRVGADYLGWWTDEETGKLWVDATSWHADYDEAERLCRERGEIAFWSIADQREFRPVVQG
jgi:hypothetical protein